MIIELTDKQVEQLKELLDDFETGWIANPTSRATQHRLKQERLIRQIVEQFPKEQSV